MAGDPDQIVPLRHYGRWVSGAVVLALLALIVRAFAQGQIDWPVVKEFFFSPVLVKGLGNTLLITVLAIVMGLALGVVFAVMRLSRNPVTNTVANAYIWLFRGTPVYLQLLIWFNLALVFPTVNLGFWKARMVDVMTPFLAALLGLGINEGAYMTEIVRGGILSVDRGQLEAAATLGMPRLQAMRVIIPPIGNEFIGLLKTSSMASTIAFTEILHRAQLIYFVNAKVIELLIVAAGWYMIVVTLFTFIQIQVEKRFARGQGHEPPPTWLQSLWRNLLTHRAVVPGAASGNGGPTR